MKAKLFLTLLLFITFSIVSAQSEIELVKTYLAQEKSERQLTDDDFSNLKIDSKHFSKSTNIEHVYVQQNYNEIAVYNAIGSFAIRDGIVESGHYNFENNLASKVKNQKPSISPKDALNAVAAQLGLEKPVNTSILKSYPSNYFLLSKSDISLEEIPVKLVYQSSESGDLKLAWDLSIYLVDGSHWWSVRVDAINGRILEKQDWVVQCNFDHSPLLERQLKTSFHSEEIQSKFLFTNGSSYNVFPYPLESPNHGPREIVTNPADANFSAFGWHDTDGVEGAEYTITRGNNVHAYEDRSNTNTAGYSPDGGESLNFDHPLDLDRPAKFNQDAAITNLFYWNNITHDMWAHYGFDEASGNFQQINYGGRGLGDDYVRAEAQDGNGLNNANFATPPDGSRPRMQMFLWSAGPLDEPLSIDSPQGVAGKYDGRAAGFGPEIPISAISAEFVLALDGESTLDPVDACEELVNQENLNQKIVVIRRGECSFVSKIQKAQNAGALAVIMVNNVFGDPIVMGGDDIGITIPSIMISQADGEPIIQALLNGEIVNGELANNGPYQVDGDFDNGIIAHEYAHGISNRLTGGARSASCLGNNEQMGEGWSDWVGLMMTISEGDLATQGRGIGTFATSQPKEGVGIRPFQYSTDTSTNPATYGLTNNSSLSQPHGIGFVWATMLWDLNWALIDRYGFDSNLYTGTGGNNINMQLVIDGMKLQVCEPGFVDARDAILEADRLANDGANQCLIWEVFANRGLGWSAEQGSSDDRSDQVEAFDLPPSDILNCSLSNESFNSGTFGIYPNPARKSFRLNSTERNLANVEVNVYDMNGKLILTKTSDNNQKVNIETLNSGIYIVLVNLENKTFTKKLIVE